MEAVENQRTVYHRSHRPWKSLRDYHTPAARRLLTHNETKTRPGCHLLNSLPACLNNGVQSSLSPIFVSPIFVVTDLLHCALNQFTDMATGTASAGTLL
jgi:hypothetical protein